MKNITNWKELNRRTTPQGTVDVLYEVNGYHIIVKDADYMPGGYMIMATAIEKDGSSYLPEISINEIYDKDYQKIAIQTVSRGSVTPSEIDKIIEGYKTAQTVAQEIQAAFPECFTKAA